MDQETPKQGLKPPGSSPITAVAITKPTPSDDQKRNYYYTASGMSARTGTTRKKRTTTSGNQLGVLTIPWIAGNLLRRFCLSLVAAIRAFSVLVAALALAAVVGVALVRYWVEEPVFLRHPIHFDYTDPHPTAVLSIAGSKGGRAVPAGHTTRATLELVMPESGYNRHIGIFQVTAQAVSSNGYIIASSSKPCMLKYRSLPVRLARTFILAVPLLLGTCSESQKIRFEVMEYMEIHQKPTEKIIVRLKPRAGTSYLPQLYEARLELHSQLPRQKQLVYNWKWTFCVWISLYIYIMLLIVLVCCFRPFPFSPWRAGYGRAFRSADEEEDFTKRGELESDRFSPALRRWRERRRKKEGQHVLVEGPASSLKGETGKVIEDSSSEGEEMGEVTKDDRDSPARG